MTTQALWKKADGTTACEVSFERGRIRVDLDLQEGGGGDPNPHDLLDAALAACTALTLELYAKRKGYAIDELRVEVSHAKGAAGEILTRSVHAAGELSDEERASLLRIAEKCPIHKALTGHIDIVTSPVQS